MDHAGLPLTTVLEQLEMLGDQVVPVLRREFEALRPEHIPPAPTHANRVAAARAGDDPAVGSDSGSVGSGEQIIEGSLIVDG
jgi:hypothetical protein